MKQKNLFPQIILSLLFLSQTFAQINISSVSINGGVIKNFTQEELESNEFTFYPEISIGGQLFIKSIYWQISYGYWDDGIKKELKDFRFYSTFNFISNVVSSRLLFDLSNVDGSFYIPFKIISGISYHNLKAQLKFPRGAPYEFIIEKFEKQIYYGDIGIESFLCIYGKLFFNLRYINFIPLNEKRFYKDIKRYLITGGVEYKL